MRDYTLDNATIILTLLRSGHTHHCSRCQKGMLVKYTSGLCVECYNVQRRAVSAALAEHADADDDEPVALLPATAH